MGGAGATSVAANLAVLRAQQQSSCGLIDLSGGFGELATLFGLQPRHTMTELCSGSESLDLEMLRNSISEHDSGVHLVASGPVTTEWTFDSNQSVRRVVETSQKLLPTVVLDVTRRAPFSHELLNHCHQIVLLTTLDFRAACSTHRLLQSWKEQGISLDRVLIVANRSGQKGELAVSMFNTILSHDVQFQIPDDPLTANMSVNCGNPAVLESPRSALAGGLGDLDRLITKRLGGSDVAAESEEPRRVRVPALFRKIAAGFV